MHEHDAAVGRGRGPRGRRRRGRPCPCRSTRGRAAGPRGARAEVERLAAARASGRRTRRRSGRGRSAQVPTGVGQAGQRGGRGGLAGHDVVEVGAGADVDAEHRVVVAPARRRDRRGCRRCRRRWRSAAVSGSCSRSSERGAHVAELPDGGRAAQRHGVRTAAGGAAADRPPRRWRPRGRSSRAGPAHTISGPSSWSSTTLPVATSTGRSRARCVQSSPRWLAAAAVMRDVVRLAPAAGDEHVAALGDRRRRTGTRACAPCCRRRPAR